MKLRPDLRRWLLAAGALAAVVVVVVLVRGARKRSTVQTVTTQPVTRRDIALTIDATGTVEPIDLVEVKSKASGQIVRMPVQVGSHVAAGALLAQIDTRDVKNQYDQSFAALRAAQAKVDVSRAQKKRSDDLFQQQVITADEHEAATLDFANAQAQLVKARTDLDISKQRLEDATVRAPIAGTVLEQLVSSGQVISSATSSASGGTALLKMADLTRIRLRVLVTETDIGNVRPGQVAVMSVDAFPQHTFSGVVEKVEPQAVVQQTVTMFPVLVSIENEGGVLLPGMNGEVTMLVDHRENALAIPVDAARSAREIGVVAAALGLKPDSVSAQVARQIEAQAAERGPRLGAAGDSAVGNGFARQASFGADSSRRRMGRGGRSPGDSTAGRRRGGMRRGQWASGGGGAGGAGGMLSGARPGGGGGTGGTQSGGAWAGGGRGGRASRAQVVIVKTAKGLEPRVVRLGLSDFDYYEVLQGLQEGEQVALLGIAEARASRQETQSMIRQRMGGGMPGVPGGGRAGGGGGSGGGSGGGGRRPGGS